jgi:hypothetical protein
MVAEVCGLVAASRRWRELSLHVQCVADEEANMGNAAPRESSSRCTPRRESIACSSFEQRPACISPSHCASG